MTEEVIENLIAELHIEPYPPRPTGGQNVGIFIQGIKMKCEETGFEMVSTWHRSQLKNRDLIVKMYRKYLKEIDESQV
jgi:protein subunit release factor A